MINLNVQTEYLDAFVDTVREYAIRTLIEEESELVFAYNSNPTINSVGEERSMRLLFFIR